MITGFKIVLQDDDNNVLTLEHNGRYVYTYRSLLKAVCTCQPKRNGDHGVRWISQSDDEELVHHLTELFQLSGAFCRHSEFSDDIGLGE